MFFQEKDEVHKTLRRLVRRLNAAGIAYALLGGMALKAHHYKRTTDDVDVLLSAEGFDRFREEFVPKWYANVEGRSRRFIDKKSQVKLDILVTGLFPGSGKPGPIAFPDPAVVAITRYHQQVVDLPTLIQLKLAARRYKDFGDVVELIRRNELDEAFVEKLHTSVHGDYIECLEEKRREDEYEAQQ